MVNVILTIHIIACIAMTIVIMLQKSEGGALGIGGGGGGMMTGRSAAGLLVRVTMVFGGIFFLTSLGLTTLANKGVDNRTLLERTVEESQISEDGNAVPVIDSDTSLLDSLGPDTAPTPEADPALEPVEPPADPVTPDEQPEETVDNP